MKSKLLLSLSLLLLTIGLAIPTDILELVPQESTFVVVLSDNAENYNALKENVPLFYSLISDLGLELFIQQQLEMYRYSQDIDLDSFYEFLSHNMAFYTMTDGRAGLVAGPFSDAQKVANALSKILKTVPMLSITPSITVQPKENYVVVTPNEEKPPEHLGFSMPLKVLEKVPENAWGAYYAKGEGSEAYGWFAVDGNTLHGRGFSRVEDEDLLEAIKKAPKLGSLKGEKVFPEFAIAITMPGEAVRSIVESIPSTDLSDFAREILKNSGDYLLISGKIEVVSEQDQQKIEPWLMVRSNTRLGKAEFEKLMKERGYTKEGDDWVVHGDNSTFYVSFDEKRSEIVLTFKPLNQTRAELEKKAITLYSLMERLSIPENYRGMVFVDNANLLEKLIGVGVDSQTLLKVHEERDTVVTEFILQ